MRIVVLLVVVGLSSGCAKMKSWRPGGEKKQDDSAVAAPSAKSPLTVRYPGKIAMVNTNAGFVVMTFPLGEVPSVNETLIVYRAGKKVAEVKTSGPQRDNNTVADIVSGEPRVNDEARVD
jgi:hypothetical protein